MPSGERGLEDRQLLGMRIRLSMANYKSSGHGCLKQTVHGELLIRTISMCSSFREAQLFFPRQGLSKIGQCLRGQIIDNLLPQGVPPENSSPLIV